MKVTSRPTIVIHVLSILSASAHSATDDASHAISGVNFLRGVKGAPIVLDDLTKEDNNGCIEAERVECSTRGYDCIDSKCVDVDPYDDCDADTDECATGYDCILGICQKPIGPGGSCNANTQVCVDGYSCLDSICQAIQRERPTDIPYGGVCSVGDICADGYQCINGLCGSSGIPYGGVCSAGDICADGYQCINGRCGSSGIPAGGVCQIGGELCENGYTCIDGLCAIPLIPVGEVCRDGIDTCVSGYICLEGRCSTSPGWYTNWEYCILDCPSSAGSCCGGYAEKMDVLYSSVDSCCSQSALEWKYDECVRQSNSCFNEDSDEQLGRIE